MRNPEEPAMNVGEGKEGIGASPQQVDTGLICLLILARFYDLPADGSQLRHQFAQSGQPLSDTELLRAAKHFGLKAGMVTTTWGKLPGTPFPAMAKRTDGRYVVLAKIEGEKALIQDPVAGRPLVLSREQFESAWTGDRLRATGRHCRTMLRRRASAQWNHCYAILTNS